MGDGSCLRPAEQPTAVALPDDTPQCPFEFPILAHFNAGSDSGTYDTDLPSRINPRNRIPLNIGVQTIAVSPAPTFNDYANSIRRLLIADSY